MRGGMRGGRRQGVGWRRRMQRAGEGLSGDQGRGTRGAHIEHAAHVCDAGGVEAQRLVERRRVLPSAARRAYDARRHAGREAGGRAVATAHAACRRGPEWASRGGARAERTWNMLLMFVTLEVSRLSGWLKYDASCRVPQGGRTVRGGMRGGRREGVRRRRRMQRAGEGLTGHRGVGHARSAPGTCCSCL